MRIGFSVLLIVAVIGLMHIPESHSEDSDSSCSLKSNLRNQAELVEEDVVLKEFLRLFPEHRVARASSVEQSDPPQISVTWYAKDVYFFSMRILEHDRNDPSNCYAPDGYRLNAPHLPAISDPFYHDDPLTVLNQLEELEAKHIRGDDPELLQLKEKMGKTGTDYLIELEFEGTFVGKHKIENATIGDVSYDGMRPAPSLTFTLGESENGHMLVEIPGGLLYPANREYQSRYFVTFDGIDAPFAQHSPTLLEIPFNKGTKEIKIAGDFFGGVKCESETVREKYDSHDAVVLGVVRDRENIIPSDTVRITIDVTDTLKGETPNTLVISPGKYHRDLFFEDFGYVIFLNEKGSEYEIPFCTPTYHALPRILSSMSALDGSFMDIPSHLVEEGEYLSEEEEQELKKIRWVERKLLSKELDEVGQGYEIFWSWMPVGIVASVGIAAVAVIIKLKR